MISPKHSNSIQMLRTKLVNSREFHLLWLCYQYKPCRKNNCAKLFLAELWQISTNFDNLWQKDGKEAKIMQGALIFHLI